MLEKLEDVRLLSMAKCLKQWVECSQNMEILMENKTSVYIWQYWWERNQTWTFQNFDEFLAILTAKMVITRGKIGTWLIDHHKSFVSKRPIVWGQKKLSHTLLMSRSSAFCPLPAVLFHGTGTAWSSEGLVQWLSWPSSATSMVYHPPQKINNSIGIWVSRYPWNTRESTGSNAVSNCPITLPIFYCDKSRSNPHYRLVV